MDYSAFDTYPVLTTERLTLQVHEERDAHDLFKLRSDPEVMRYMDAPLAKSVNTVLDRIREIRQDFENQKGINFTIKQNNSQEAMGYMSLWKIDHTNHRVEIGYALQKSFWGQGFAFEAAKRVIDFAFYELKAHSISANINPENKTSASFLKKLGFKQEAYFRENFFFDGTFLDSAIFCLLVSDWNRR